MSVFLPLIDHLNMVSRRLKSKDRRISIFRGTVWRSQASLGRRFNIPRMRNSGFGAVEKTRTSTGCPTATSTLRVYQFRHDRKPKANAGKPARRT
jgi:inner membrane protein involved in colicin E2 resistance